jgi:hypothetical protein
MAQRGRIAAPLKLKSVVVDTARDVRRKEEQKIDSIGRSRPGSARWRKLGDGVARIAAIHLSVVQSRGGWTGS